MEDNHGKNLEANSLGDWVVSKVGVSKVQEQVLNNLKMGIKNSSVLRHHVSLCARHKITSALPLIEIALNNPNGHAYDLAACYEDFLELGGNRSVVEAALDSNNTFDNHDRARLIETLIKHSSEWIKTFLKDGLKNGDVETQKAYCKYLMRMGLVEGLVHYKNWVEKSRTFDDSIGSKHFLSIPSQFALPLLIDMVEIYLKPDFDRDNLHAQDQDLLDTICNVAAQDTNRYKFVKEKFEKFITDYNGKILFYYSRRLDQLYYSTLTDSLTIAEIAMQVDSLLKK